MIMMARNECRVFVLLCSFFQEVDEESPLLFCLCMCFVTFSLCPDCGSEWAIVSDDEIYCTRAKADVTPLSFSLP